MSVRFYVASVKNAVFISTFVLANSASELFGGQY